MTCDEVRPLLSAYVDRELELLKSLEVDAHLATCAACAAERDRLLRLSEALRDPALQEPLSEELRARVRSALRRESPRAQPVWPLGLGLAATLVLGLLGGSALLQTGASSLTSELVSAHIRSLLPNRLMDVESSDRHTVKPFFHGRLDYAPPVPDLGDSGFPLAGGRVDVIDRQRVAALVYMRRQHVVNVFVLPKGTRRPPSGLRTAEGYAVLGFEEGGFQFWAVSDLDPVELRRLPELVRAALAPGPA